MVFWARLNRICKQYHKKEKKERKKRRSEITHEGQHATMHKTPNIFTNQLHPFFECIEHMYIQGLSYTISIRTLSLTSKLKI
jgi:hypothetical protein